MLAKCSSIRHSWLLVYLHFLSFCVTEMVHMSARKPSKTMTIYPITVSAMAEDNVEMHGAKFSTTRQTYQWNLEEKVLNLVLAFPENWNREVAVWNEIRHAETKIHHVEIKIHINIKSSGWDQFYFIPVLPVSVAMAWILKFYFTFLYFTLSCSNWTLHYQFLTIETW